jgi:hypothetical protein
MPYLDLTDPDNFDHLIQLFLAAHPAHWQTNDAIRVHKGMPGRYFLSMDMARELAAWGRGRHLITRKDAARIVEVVTNLFADPASIVSLTPRMLGIPPRLQPTVLGPEMFHWLHCQTPKLDAGEEVVAWTIPAALQILQSTVDDPEE